MTLLHSYKPSANGQHSSALHSIPQAPHGSKLRELLRVHPAEHSLAEEDLVVHVKVRQGEIYKPLGECKEFGSRTGSGEHRKG